MLIIPGSSKFRDALNARSERKFTSQAMLADHMSMAVKLTARKYKMTVPDVIEGVLVQLVSIVQASVPETEWSDVSQALCEQVSQRLTVTGVH